MRELTPEIEAMAGDRGSALGSGGMITKLQAARIALAAGCRMAIAPGKTLSPLKAMEDGGRCTWFLPPDEPLTARKQWIAGSLKPQGTLIVDAGAKRALRKGGSLLPAGVVVVDGDFQKGEAVVVADRDNHRLGVGLTAYSADDARHIIGPQEWRLRKPLGVPWCRRNHPPRRSGDRAMNQSAVPAVQTMMADLGRAAQAAARQLALAGSAQKNAALMAGGPPPCGARRARFCGPMPRMSPRRPPRGLSAALLDRLTLDGKRVEAMAKGLEDIAALADPVGQEIARWTRPNGLDIARVRVPIGGDRHHLRKAVPTSPPTPAPSA